MNLKSSLRVSHGLINYQIVVFFLISKFSWQVSRKKGKKYCYEKCLKSLCLKGPKSLGIDFLWGLEQNIVLFWYCLLVYQLRISGNLLCILKFHTSRLSFCLFFICFLCSFFKNHGVEIKKKKVVNNCVSTFFHTFSIFWCLVWCIQNLTLEAASRVHSFPVL